MAQLSFHTMKLQGYHRIHNAISRSISAMDWRFRNVVMAFWHHPIPDQLHFLALDA